MIAAAAASATSWPDAFVVVGICLAADLVQHDVNEFCEGWGLFPEWTERAFAEVYAV